jgi:hypothetical protein
MLDEIKACIPDSKRIDVKTDCSMETLGSSLAMLFKAKVIIVNHEKRL